MNPNLAIEPGASHCMENGQYFSIQGKSSQSWTMPSRLLDKPNEQIIGFPFVRYIAIPIEPAGRTYLDQMVACIPLHIPLYLILYPMHSQYKYIPFQIHQKSSNCTSHCRPPDLPPDIPVYIYIYCHHCSGNATCQHPGFPTLCDPRRSAPRSMSLASLRKSSGIGHKMIMETWWIQACKTVNCRSISANDHNSLT